MQAGASTLGYDLLVKIILVGDTSVGKTCMITRLCDNTVPKKHQATIGKCIIS